MFLQLAVNRQLTVSHKPSVSAVCHAYKSTEAGAIT